MVWEVHIQKFLIEKENGWVNYKKSKKLHTWREYFNILLVGQRFLVDVHQGMIIDIKSNVLSYKWTQKTVACFELWFVAIMVLSESPIVCCLL